MYSKILAVCSLCLAACGSAGPVGPQGPAGQPGTPGAGVLTNVDAADSPTSYSLTADNVPNGVNTTWTNIPIAGRAGLPANATAVYVQLYACSNAGNTASLFVWVTAAGAVHAFVNTPATGECTEIDPIVPLDATQTLKLGSAAAAAGQTGGATIEIMGWIAPG